MESSRHMLKPWRFLAVIVKEMPSFLISCGQIQQMASCVINKELSWQTVLAFSIHIENLPHACRRHFRGHFQLWLLHYEPSAWRVELVPDDIFLPVAWDQNGIFHFFITIETWRFFSHNNWVPSFLDFNNSDPSCCSIGQFVLFL